MAFDVPMSHIIRRNTERYNNISFKRVRYICVSTNVELKAYPPLKGLRMNVFCKNHKLELAFFFFFSFLFFSFLSSPLASYEINRMRIRARGTYIFLTKRKYARTEENYVKFSFLYVRPFFQLLRTKIRLRKVFCARENHEKCAGVISFSPSLSYEKL